MAQPTLSTQLKQLEESLGAKLFVKAGRGLTLTDTGKVVYRYSEEIFGLGQELRDVVAGRAVARPEAFVVGVSDVLSKLLVHRLLQPAFETAEPPRLVCREDAMGVLLEDLARHEVDLVLADHPLPSKSRIKAYSHLLGESGLDWFAAPELLRRHRDPFPRCLEGAPVLLPAPGTALRGALDNWFVSQDLRVKVVGEFDDSALLKAFGQEGTGFFPGPAVLAREIQRQHKVNRVGAASGLSSCIYAISVERRVKHPAVVAILKGAKKDVFQALHAAGAPDRPAEEAAPIPSPKAAPESRRKKGEAAAAEPPSAPSFVLLAEEASDRPAEEAAPIPSPKAAPETRRKKGEATAAEPPAGPSQVLLAEEAPDRPAEEAAPNPSPKAAPESRRKKGEAAAAEPPAAPPFGASAIPLPFEW